MMKIALKKLPVFLLFLFAMPLYAINISGGHRDNITSLIHNGDAIISAGEDGFIVIWDVSEEAATERFQLTQYAISNMVKHPQREQICIVESAGMDDYRITVWDYENKTKLFSLRSKEPVTYISYSAGGSYIIASGFGGSPVTLLDSTTGEVFSADVPEGNITLAITGRTERNMLVYQPDHDYFAPVEYSGLIFYLDTDSLSVTSSFQAPGSLLSPVIFGNNRFLAGLNADGLIIVDAATGAVYDSMENIERSALLYSSGDGFYCLSQNGGNAVLYKFTINNRGNLVTDMRIPLSTGASTISLFAYNGGAAFASGSSLLLPDRQNRTIPLDFSFQERITEIAHTDNIMAFLTENNELCFLPVDYSLIQEETDLTLERKNGYSKIKALSGDGDKFILWQSSSTQYALRIVNASYDMDELNMSFPGRFPLRSVSSISNSILVLDSAGNSYLYNTDNLGERARLAFSSVGAIDASFINGENFLLSRSVISGNSPFLYVNINTGETVPFLYNAQAGIMSYTGKSGSIYAAAVERDSEGIKTTVINLYAAAQTRARTGASVKILEYPGEDARLSIAESGSSLAVSFGEGAAIYGENIIHFERTQGLPQILLGSDNFFICLDSEGSISWHDNATGSLLAVFRLYEENWTLSSDREISGRLSRN
jgi:WD40 repeat protein